MISKSIWLTGSRGFIGKHLVDGLKKNNLDYKCYSNNPDLKNKVTETKGNILYMNFSSKADINKYIEKFGCPDTFIHLGWGDMTSSMSSLHLSGNVLDGKNLIETFFRSGLDKFIFIGSMNEYGSLVGPLSEDMKPKGRLINYAKGKINTAKYGFKAAKLFGKKFIHLRPFYVYGSGQRKGSLINELFQAFQDNRETKLGPCDHYRDYIHVLDVVEGIIRSRNLKSSCTMNLGIGSFIKVKDFVSTFWEKLGGDPAKLKFGFQPMIKNEPDQPKSYADLTKLYELTDWKPTYSIEKGIEATIKGLYDDFKK